jgi:hypothetical protein
MSDPCRRAPCFHGGSPLTCFTRPFLGFDLVSDVGGAALVLRLLHSSIFDRVYNPLPRIFSHSHDPHHYNIRRIVVLVPHGASPATWISFDFRQLTSADFLYTRGIFGSSSFQLLFLIIQLQMC